MPLGANQPSSGGDPSAEDVEQAEAKPGRRRAPEPEPVYVIPDVEKKETKFRGRLGYACLNTIMRNKKPASESVFCSRTCRIDSIKKNGIEWVKELGRKNVEDLLKIIQWNEENKIRLFRLSSEMFPFASHPIYGYSLEYCSPLLAQAGELARRYGHRLTAHPGQFTQLGSPKPNVVEASVRELQYHSEMLDLMGVGSEGVLVIHGGGVYEDKTATLGRLRNTIRDVLPKRVKERLVLENDELCYNAEDLLPLCDELDVPLVFDYHHDSINPSSIPPREIVKRANAIFQRRGIRPKQHLSEPRPGAVTIMERRAHADRCSSLPTEMEEEGVSMDVDLMIEAKDKEQAVLELYRMYDLEEVKHESLRPPNEQQTKETKGRKSNKKRKAKDDDRSDGQIEKEETTNSRPKRRKNVTS
ncbi:UV-endonuclease UvdE [Marasmius fiardii PR-910]|nr:UV-endonuclease UvdE [Marasmius fiardii PR-910]